MAKKDANAPTRARSAYIIFCQEQRESLLKKKPGLKATEVTSALGEMWRNLSDEKRKPFQDKAEKDKQRYADEMKKYTPPAKEEVEVKGKKEKKRNKKDENAPKRAPSAYIIFCQEQRSSVKEDYPDFGPKEITSKLGELWRELDDETKAEYSQKSKNGAAKNLKVTVEKQDIQTTKRKSKSSHHSEDEEEEEEEVKPKKRNEKPKKVRRKVQDSESELDD